MLFEVRLGLIFGSSIDPVQYRSVPDLLARTPIPRNLQEVSSKVVLRTAQIHQRFIATRYATFVKGVVGRGPASCFPPPT